MASRIDPGLRHQIARLGAKDLGACMSCGFCTATCTLTTEYESFPRRIVHLLQVGHEQRLAGSLEPWLCYYCGECSEACPRNANPGEIMMAARRYLAGVYDWTGISARILRSRAAHFAALALVAAATLALIVFFHVWYVQYPFAQFIVTPMGLGHMFPAMTYLTVGVILLPLALMLSRIPRIWRATVGNQELGRIPFSAYFAEAWTYVRHAATQSRMRDCADPGRWFGHFMLAFGVMLMLAIKLFALRWFQTDAIYPIYNPQRWLGYLGFICIVYGLGDVVMRRREFVKQLRFEDLVLPTLLLGTAVSGIAVHLSRYLGFPMTAMYFYAAHLAIVTPLLLVELPFGEWSHAIYRPLALYLEGVRRRSQSGATDVPAAVQAAE